VLMAGVLLIAENKKARHDYLIEKVFEAGLVLTGSEVKSLRERKVQLKDSYVASKFGELYWVKGHIAEFDKSSYNNHEPERARKLLLHKQEVHQIMGAIEKKGYTCVPLKIYFKNGRAKLEIALAKGKTKGDKRDSLKTKEAQRAIQRAMRH